MMNADKPPRQKNLRSALGGAFFGLVVAAIGCFFVYALWVGFGRAKETRGWAETACQITRSEVVEERPTPNSPVAYRAVVEYSYEFGGQSLTGTKIKRVDGPTSHPKRAAQVTEEFPSGLRLNCWVNPDNPAQAILKHGTLAPLYSIWFPGLFVVAGIGIAVNSLRRALP